MKWIAFRIGLHMIFGQLISSNVKIKWLDLPLGTVQAEVSELSPSPQLVTQKMWVCQGPLEMPLLW